MEARVDEDSRKQNGRPLVNTIPTQVLDLESKLLLAMQLHVPCNAVCAPVSLSCTWFALSCPRFEGLVAASTLYLTWC